MPYNFFKPKAGNIIRPTAKVCWQQGLKGYVIPAITHNLSYHFADLHVYENGRVSGWSFEDFDRFVNDVEEGYVLPSLPSGQAISIQGLGSWTIDVGEWFFNKDTFIAYVRSLVKDLNPKWKNIYKYKATKVNGITIGEDGRGTIYKEEKSTPDDGLPIRKDGGSINLFYNSGSEYHLVMLNVFGENDMELSRLETPIAINLTDFDRLVSEKTISTTVPAGATVHIYGLGKFSIQSAQDEDQIQIDEKRREVEDILNFLGGVPTSYELCEAAYKTYQDNPTAENKEKLRTAYESVPGYHRINLAESGTLRSIVWEIPYGKDNV